MIMLTRLNGPTFALNSDLIERAEATPDTVLTLIDGTKLVVNESVGEVIDRTREYRASIAALARRMEIAADERDHTGPLPRLHVVDNPLES
jgi:flagellar protein FlbD